MMHFQLNDRYKQLAILYLTSKISDKKEYKRADRTVWHYSLKQFNDVGKNFVGHPG